MANQQKQKKKLRYKYRFSIINEDTFEEVWRSRLSRFNVMALMFFYALLVTSITVLAVVFTPLKTYIPGYPDAMVSKGIVENYLLADSLQYKVDQQARFYSAIHSIMEGDIPDDWQAHVDTTELNDTNNRNFTHVNLEPTYADSMFRLQIEEEERYTLSMLDQISMMDEEDELLLVLPVKGVVTNNFDPGTGHFGVDIVSGENEKIMAVADGTVIMAEWTINSGYVIQIQHQHNLVSVYKHNSDLMKEVGDKVKAGEAIALMGNTGELSHGAHLHLELWENGTPIDPKNHIVF